LDARFLDHAIGKSVTMESMIRPLSPEKPHGIDYSLTLHGPDGERLSGRSVAGRKTIGTGCGR